MDILEKINRSFAQWYEGLFGGTEDVRPRDILRMILTELEENRKEGFDTRTYVPNQYILELYPEDDEEKEYLLSFLDKAELEEAVRRYCRQNRYHIRGELEFVLKVLSPEEIEEKHPPKVAIRSRYTPRTNTEVLDRAAMPIPVEERTVVGVAPESTEGHTVVGIAKSYLQVQTPGRSSFRYPLLRNVTFIGRSARVGNDLVLEGDPMVSKRHLRIELAPDGRYTLYDLGSTNGTWVNGSRVEQHELEPGDDVLIGSTHLLFEQEAPPAKGATTSDEAQAKAVVAKFGGAAAAGKPVTPSTPTAKIFLMEGEEVKDTFLLGSETFLGRGITNDIVLPYRGVAIRHARIYWQEGHYCLESQESSPLILNDMPVYPGETAVLQSGDRIRIGDVNLCFEIGTHP